MLSNFWLQRYDFFGTNYIYYAIFFINGLIFKPIRLWLEVFLVILQPDNNGLDFNQ